MRLFLNSVLIVILSAILIFINYRIWISDNGYSRYSEIGKIFEAKDSAIKDMRAENADLHKEIEDLRHSTNMIEYSARSDLGLIKLGEIYYQFKD